MWNFKKRKQYIINPKFQFTLIGYVALLALFIMAVLYGANYYFFWHFADLGRELDLPNEHIYFVFLNEQKIYLNTVYLVTSVCVSLALLITGIFISHRIAGPIYRACKFLSENEIDKPERVILFRKKDFFPELAEAINEHLKQLENKKNDNNFKAA